MMVHLGVGHNAPPGEVLKGWLNLVRRMMDPDREKVFGG